MSNIPSFSEFFSALWSDNAEHPLSPFPWQNRLAESVLSGPWPRNVSLPTGTGKTSIIDIWVWALAKSAIGEGNPQPRRLFFVIDRRIVVDSVFERAAALAKALRAAEEGPLADVAAALNNLGGQQPLLAARLRGGLEIDPEWATDLTQPLICASTVDQVGSRLLFRGYGLRRISAKNPLSIHAALVGNDSLLIVDEAHMSAPFDETLCTIEQLRSHMVKSEIDKPFACVRMTATPRTSVCSDTATTFSLDEADKEDERLNKRLYARKPAALIEKKGTQAFEKAVIDETKKLLQDDEVKTIGIVLNRVAHARAVFEKLQATLKRGRKPSDADIHLIIGPSRAIERDTLMAGLLPRLRAGRERREDTPLIVVATQTIEVGADLDFDALITECAAADALRQRFGRLDRLGTLNGTARAVIIHNASGKKPDPVYGTSIDATWEWLNAQKLEADANNEVLDVGPLALDSTPPEALSQPAHSPVFFPAYLDRLCQTSPLPTPDPSVELFLHGFDTGSADVNIVWRADITQENEEHWKDIVSLLPPRGRESLSVSYPSVVRWLQGPATLNENESDIESFSGVSETNEHNIRRPVLLWHGADSDETRLINAGETRLTPGDTIIVPSTYGGCDDYGWAPETTEKTRDLAEQAAVERGRQLLRLQPDVLTAHGVPTLGLEEILTPSEDDESLLVPNDTGVEQLLAAISESESSLAELATALLQEGLEFSLYPNNEKAVLVKSSKQEAKTRKKPGNRPVFLRDHQSGVEGRVRTTARALGLSETVTNALTAAAANHDEGKRDPRFQTLLAGGTPVSSDEPLAKSNVGAHSSSSFNNAREQSGLPRGFRHEAGSCALLERENEHDDLVLHLIASHHGCARPYMPAIVDENPWINTSEILRIDGAVPTRFWQLTRRFGWWELAYLEAILRLADHAQSAEEDT